MTFSRKTKYVLSGFDYYAAARVAASLDLHLSEWEFVFDLNANTEPTVYVRLSPEDVNERASAAWRGRQGE